MNRSLIRAQLAAQLASPRGPGQSAHPAANDSSAPAKGPVEPRLQCQLNVPPWTARIGAIAQPMARPG